MRRCLASIYRYEKAVNVIVTKPASGDLYETYAEIFKEGATGAGKSGCRR
jgi:hypothetical protein